MVENIEKNLSLLRELITCGQDLYFWSFDLDFTLRYTNCPAGKYCRDLFGITPESIDSGKKLAKRGYPVVMTGPVGLLWIAAFEKSASGEPILYHVIGPVFPEDIPRHAVETEVGNMALTGPEKRDLRDWLLQVPLLPIMRFYNYGLMLHYCITEEKISCNEFQYWEMAPRVQKRRKKTSVVSSHGTWAMEQRLLRLVESGNLNYKKEASQMVSHGNLGSLGNGDQIRNLKNHTIIFTALCTRAAIRGGLTPEIAYTLSDRYISGIEASTTLTEIAEINAAMQDDFINRVHKMKSGNGCSPQVQNCCNYLQIHLTERICIPELAAMMGYSSSYLSKIFKQEIGSTIKEYITSLRIQQAQDALRNNNESIQNICHRLGFSSQSYFGEQFKRATGMTPMEYRAKQGLK